MGQLGMDGQCREMALLAIKVLLGAVRPSKVRPWEVTVMAELGAAGYTAPGLFVPRLRLPPAGNKRPWSGLIQSGQGDGCGSPDLQAGRGGPAGFAAARVCLRHGPGGWLAASPAPRGVHSLLRVPAPSWCPSLGTAAAPCRVCGGRPHSPGSHTMGDRSSRWLCPPHPPGHSLGLDHASRVWGGREPVPVVVGTLETLTSLVSSIKGEVLTGWAG